MAYVSIPDSKREVGKPVDKDLVDNVHDNLEDLNERVNAISLAAGSNIIINEIVKKPKDSLPIGTLVHGSVTTAEFQAQVDDGEWVLADGSSAAGSDWATLTGRTTLPDARGRFLRGKDAGSGNNSDGDKTLDSYTADTTKAHVHDMSHGHSNTFGLTGTTTFASSTHKHDMSHDHQWGQMSSSVLSSWDSSGTLQTVLQGASTSGITGVNTNTVLSVVARDFYTKPNSIINPAGGFLAGIVPLTDVPTATGTVGFTGAVTSHSGNTGSTGNNETAPRYVTENIFMKINRAYIKTNTRLFVARIAQQTTVNSILVTPVVQGTSGNFKIDIKKGSSPTTATQSIFQTGQEPTLAWNGSSGVTGLTDSDQNTVAAGQFIVVSVETTQAKLQEVHIMVAGDY